MSYQQPPYGQQPGPYGQPNWGPQPGWGAPPPPKKPRTGLIVSLIIVVVLVLGGGGVGIYFLAKGNDNPSTPGTGTPAGSGDPEQVADRYATLYGEAINSDLAGFDIRDFKPIMCTKDYENVRRETERTLRARETSRRKPSPRPEAARVTMGVKDLKVNGDHGTFKMTRKEPGGAGSPRDVPLDLQRDGDSWKVCGLYKDSPTPSTSRRPTMPRPSS